MEFKFTVHTRIQKPRHEVFDAVYSPDKLSKYFTTAGASAPMKTGTTVMWEFADHPGAFPVSVVETVPDELIVFEWGARKQPDAESFNTRVEIRFEEIDAKSTLVRITESGWKQTDFDLQSSYGNCMGWTHMSCCLKAYLEYGINLRRGAFADATAG